MIKNGAINWPGLAARLVNFFFGEDFRDAVRNTLTIVLPIALFFAWDNAQAAVGTGIGALLISLTDLPGNRSDKLRTAVLSTLVFFLAALTMSLVFRNAWLTASLLFLLTFLFSMMAIISNRAAATGTMAIILCTFIIGLRPAHPLLFSVYVFSGGIWHYLVSLTQTSLWPYRSLNYAIFDCLNTTASFLRAKARCYDPLVPLEECYEESIALHIKVSEKQELVRTLLLRDKKAMNPKNRKGQELLLVAQKAIALYEQTTAIHYDYKTVRNVLDKTGSLPLIIGTISLFADELEDLSRLFLKKGPDSGLSFKERIEGITGNLSAIAGIQSERASDILLKIIRNFQEIRGQMDMIRSARQGGTLPYANHRLDYKEFLSLSALDWKIMMDHLSPRSAVFRFSVRLALSLLFAFGITRWFPSEKYSYWMLLTIVIVARPRFAITWKRNKERLTGTFFGVLIGLGLFLLIPQSLPLLMLAALFLLGFFAFNRINYTLSVMCITPAVILCLSLYQGNAGYIFSERIYYTLGGCAIAFASMYLFPAWDVAQIPDLMREAIAANIAYLAEVASEVPSEEKTFKSALARKNAHIRLAALSQAIQYVKSEPYRHKTDLSRARKIQIINYRINAVITSLLLSAEKMEPVNRNGLLAREIMANLKSALPDTSPLNEVSEPGILNGPSDPTWAYLLQLSVELKAAAGGESVLVR